MGIGDPAWATRYGGGQPLPRSRYPQAQQQQAQAQGTPTGRAAAPRTYVAPHISNLHNSLVGAPAILVLLKRRSLVLPCSCLGTQVVYLWAKSGFSTAQCTKHADE